MNKIIFITGGARSGKSTFAERLALLINNQYNDKKSIAYLATSMYVDDEFEGRIKLHRQRRGENFSSHEEPLNIKDKLSEIYNDHNVFLLECLTTWLGNIFHIKTDKEISSTVTDNITWIMNSFSQKQASKDFFNHNDIFEDLKTSEIKFKNSIEQFLKDLNGDKILIIVSNEIGNGIVPENKMARDFRDELGRINQSICAMAEIAYNVISGIPVRIK